MVRSRLIAFSATVVVIAVGLYAWQAVASSQAARDRARRAEQERAQAARAAQEERLNGCLGHTAEEVVRRLGLGQAQWFWTDEPPCILRGVTYYPDKGTSVNLFIDRAEPLYRQLNEERRWDYAAFLHCRVGGIQYVSGEEWFDIGRDVPWQWRRLR